MEMNQSLTTHVVTPHDFSLGGQLLNALVVPQSHTLSVEQLHQMHQLQQFQQLHQMHQIIHDSNGLSHENLNSVAPLSPPPVQPSPNSSTTPNRHSSGSSNKKKKKEKKVTSVTKPTKTITRRKEINEYSQSHQSRIRDQLHKKLLEVAGSDENVLPLLQNFFFSHDEGKKYFEKLHPPQQELQRFYNILPVLKRNCTKPNKKLFIRLLRHANFTKSQAEQALGITICNDTWKKAGLVEEPILEKKRKINDEVARAIIEWMRVNTRPTKKTTQIKTENGEIETVITHCVECCYHHLYIRFSEGLENREIIIPGLETISESSFRKLIPKYIKLPKKKVDCQNQVPAPMSMHHMVPLGTMSIPMHMPPMHLTNWETSE